MYSSDNGYSLVEYDCFISATNMIQMHDFIHEFGPDLVNILILMDVYFEDRPEFSFDDILAMVMQYILEIREKGGATAKA